MEGVAALDRRAPAAGAPGHRGRRRRVPAGAPRDRRRAGAAISPDFSIRPRTACAVTCCAGSAARAVTGAADRWPAWVGRRRRQWPLARDERHARAHQRGGGAAVQRRGARDHDQRRYRAHQGEQDRPARGPALRATSGRPRSTRSAATWRCPDTPPARCFAGCCAVATAVANRSARTASGGSFASGLRPCPAARRASRRALVPGGQRAARVAELQQAGRVALA